VEFDIETGRRLSMVTLEPATGESFAAEDLSRIGAFATDSASGCVYMTSNEDRSLFEADPETGAVRLLLSSCPEELQSSSRGHSQRGQKPMAIGPLFDIKTAGWRLNEPGVSASVLPPSRIIHIPITRGLATRLVRDPWKADIGRVLAKDDVRD
jgi:hypothetical protein